MPRRAPKSTYAEQLRRHREEMVFALAHNLPLAEARRQLAYQRLRDGEAARAAIGSVQPKNGHLPSQMNREPEGQPDQPWMMRE